MDYALQTDREARQRLPKTRAAKWLAKVIAEFKEGKK